MANVVKRPIVFLQLQYVHLLFDEGQNFIELQANENTIKTY